jgi:cell division protein FtsB
MSKEFEDYLKHTISKHSRLNKILLGITYFALIVGVFALFSRQDDLLKNNNNLAKNISALNQKNNELHRTVSELYAANERLNDSVNMWASAQHEKKAKSLDRSGLGSNGRNQILTHIDSSDFVVTNISITDSKSKGSKESSTAKRVNKLIFSFDIMNKGTSSYGASDAYVCITDPYGKIVTTPQLGSGRFTINGDVMDYTARVPINLSNQGARNFSFSWQQHSEFKHGLYQIDIFIDGKKVGHQEQNLKKGGLFN